MLNCLCALASYDGGRQCAIRAQGARDREGGRRRTDRARPAHDADGDERAEETGRVVGRRAAASRAGAAIRAEILRLQAQLRFTLLYVTHNREEAFELGSRVLLMRDGQMELEGLVSEVRRCLQTLASQPGRLG